MKNHWLEKRRTKEQRARVLREIAKNGIIWFAPAGLNRSAFKPKKKVSNK
jgi:hypothetical protein